MQKVWFTSDLHFFHQNVSKYCPNRITTMGMESGGDVATMNKWIEEAWNQTVGKKDHVYILGDVSFGNAEETRKIMQRLRGQKHLIRGNHDATCSKVELRTYFNEIADLKTVVFKSSVFPFLSENLVVSLCHYRILTWDRKPHGSIHLHGHSHGRLDEYNESSTDLAVDVGLDAALSSYNLISLETIWEYIMRKTGGLTPSEYVKTVRENAPTYNGAW